MPELHMPWLELAILIPLLGAAWATTARDREAARGRSLVVCLLVLGCAVAEWIDFATLGSFEAHDHWDVIAMAFHKGVFVVDELSAPLLPLAALLYLMTVLSTLRTKANRFSFGRTLVSEAILLATLSCKEPWVIIALLVAATIPPWLELRARGRDTRVYCFHMGAFAALLVAGQAAMDLGIAGAHTAALAGSLLAAAGLIRSGVFPLHCWMTDLFEKGTFGTALLYVTPMAGAYAVMRLVLPVAPEWVLETIAVISLATAFYAAGMALVQHEARRFFCYLFLSHSSLVLVGLEAATPVALTGALCVWLSVGLSMAGFGLTLRGVESRTGRLSLDVYQGFFEHMPTLAALFLITGLASIGFPGTAGFVGTELLVEGAVEIHPLIGALVVGAAALNGIAILQAYFRIFTGTPRIASISLAARPPEQAAMLILVLLIIGGGLFPQPGVASRYHAAAALIRARDETTARDADPRYGQLDQRSQTPLPGEKDS